MPIVINSYDTSTAPVSGECQTTFMIDHYAQKVEVRLVDGTLLETEYTVDKDVTRMVQCVDPLKREAIQRLEVEPEILVSKIEGLDASGRSIVTSTFVSRMSLLTEQRCSPCNGAEVSGAAMKSYRVTYDGLDTSAQLLAQEEYEKQDRFHKFHLWTPETVKTFYSPSLVLLEEIISDYNVQWGAEINSALSTTSFFSACATETTDTGCQS